MKLNENQCNNPLSTVEYCPRTSNVQFIDSEEFVLIAAFVSLAFLRLTWANLVNLKLSFFILDKGPFYLCAYAMADGCNRFLIPF